MEGSRGKANGGGALSRPRLAVASLATALLRKCDYRSAVNLGMVVWGWSRGWEEARGAGAQAVHVAG